MVYKCRQCGKEVHFEKQNDKRVFCGKECRLAFKRMKEDSAPGDPDMPPMTELSDDGAIKLSSAIVRQVTHEYLRHLKGLEKHPNDPVRIRKILDLRDEMMSPYFESISLGTDGEALIRETEENFERGKQKKKKSGEQGCSTPFNSDKG